jgi:hypothetical protein
VKPQQNNASNRPSEATDQLAEIFIFCQDNAVLCKGSGEDFLIGGTSHGFHYVENIMAIRAKCPNQGRITAFVSEEFHRIH